MIFLPVHFHLDEAAVVSWICHKSKEGQYHTPEQGGDDTNKYNQIFFFYKLLIKFPEML